MTLSLYLTAFILGFTGSGHCIAMCGPILSIIGVNTKLPQIRAALFYNLGRLSTYVVLGCLIGIISLAIADIKPIQTGLRYFAAIIMIFIGLQLIGLPNFLSSIEKVGQIIWKPISRYSKAFFPITTSKAAYFTGMIWGFLPCGMVYAALAMTTGGTSILDSTLIMLCFGIGTLPSMLTISVSGNYIGAFLRKKSARRIAGCLILIMTVFYIMTTGGGNGKHNQHGSATAPDNQESTMHSSEHMSHDMPNKEHNEMPSNATQHSH